MCIYKKWTPPRFGCQLMPINRVHPGTAMSSASLKFYLIFLLVICVIGWSAGAPSSELTRQELEERYRQTPPVPDERDADAEVDSAFDRFTIRPRSPDLKG
ncbi:LOW QUALITY PROTEIN: uncharacterized protein LOC108028539 [Drosophila biarmipes]|uniref:LOW QUALITY PROTEIN: uncharacterized protein LOC108028539 n=1 Tax=Drosophila biarmipes TaxID=125945 RepID=UPI0007E8949C|nr:LOW QUALITY PROTEIN: uncharacterized protein LOC108028539 [Drosophila biarmipes]